MNTADINRLAEDAGRMAHSDFILRMDRKQMGPHKELCPVNPDHGAMGVHGSGQTLLCTAITATQPSLRMCNGAKPLSRSDAE